MFLSRDVLQGIEDMVVDILSDMEDAMVESLIDGKGLTYGDVELSRPERILKYIDDDMMGVNAAMPQVDRQEAHRRDRQFIKDIEDSGVV